MWFSQKNAIMIGTTHGSDADIAHAAFDGAYAAARFTYSYDDASDTWTCPELTSKTAAAATKPAAGLLPPVPG